MFTAEQKEALEETVVRTINICRSEVDRELQKIRHDLDVHKVTPELAEQIATSAAIKAKQLMMQDMKNEIADSTIQVMKNAVRTVALFFVGFMLWIGAKKWPWQ